MVDILRPEGQVETWMGQLERQLLKTVRVRCAETLALYLREVAAGGVQGRARWVRSGFAQGVVLANQIAFVNDTEFAIQGGYLKRYVQRLDQQLACMTELVRQGLSKLENKCFSALLTYDVFQRDVAQALLERGVAHARDFEWLKHPKHVCNCEALYIQPVHGADEFYYRDTAPEGAERDAYVQALQACAGEAQTLQQDFLVSYQQILSTLPYQFEYLGNTMRLVITPLTLKIYSTIAMAQVNAKFCACSGPAGSGKTETSK